MDEILEKIRELAKKGGRSVKLVVDDLLANQQDDNPLGRRLKEFARMSLPPGVGDVELPTPEELVKNFSMGGITKEAKIGRAAAIKQAMEEGKNIHYAWRATSNPYKYIKGEHNIKTPLTEHEYWKGRGLYTATNPLQGATQIGSSAYKRIRDFLNPRYYNDSTFKPIEDRRGVVRMVLAPQSTFTVSEPNLQKFVDAEVGLKPSHLRPQLLGDLLRKLSQLTKVTEVDKGTYAKGTNEYIIRDTDIIKHHAWDKYTGPVKYPKIPEKSFQQIADDYNKALEESEMLVEKAQKKSPELIEELYNRLKAIGKVETGLRETSLPPPEEWMRVHKSEGKGKGMVVDELGEMLYSAQPSQVGWTPPSSNKSLLKGTSIITGKQKFVELAKQDYPGVFKPNFDAVANKYLNGIIDEERFIQWIKKMGGVKQNKLKPPLPSQEEFVALKEGKKVQPPPNFEDMSKGLQSQDVGDILQKMLQKGDAITESDYYLKKYGQSIKPESVDALHKYIQKFGADNAKKQWPYTWKTHPIWFELDPFI